MPCAGIHVRDAFKDDASGGWRQDRIEAAVAEEPRARLATAIIFAAAALIYPAWHWIFLSVMPASNDPLGERLAVAGVMIGAIVTCRIKRLRRHTKTVESVLLFAMTAHYLTLVYRNDLAVPYMAATFVLVACSSVVLARPWLTIVYATFCLAAGAVVVVSLGRPEPLAVEWFVGIASVQVAIIIGTFRASILQKAAMARVMRGRHLMKQIIETIPDPVFVRRADRTLILTNEAVRHFENATGYDLEAIVQREEESLASGRALATDARVGTYGGDLTVSVKTALAHLPQDRTMLVTVMRDVTASRMFEESLRQKVHELEHAHERVRQLQGILPICMHCSRIRTDDARWEKVETYIADRSPTSFTHTLCNECLHRHYPPEEST
jgi:hypothetical protein